MLGRTQDMEREKKHTNSSNGLRNSHTSRNRENLTAQIKHYLPLPQTQQRLIPRNKPILTQEKDHLPQNPIRLNRPPSNDKEDARKHRSRDGVQDYKQRTRHCPDYGQPHEEVRDALLHHGGGFNDWAADFGVFSWVVGCVDYVEVCFVNC